ncbi:MAG TPA: tRNA epoxyqueuosine(34) reductase QueG [Candidatus Binataceae bacterium]|nr:tRNA epoxyqueuosine(34) reductase QueG [Candidatus Binataceae bacterium]
MGHLETIITSAALTEGFILAGFARLERLDDREAFFSRWLAEGRTAEMAWLAREPERRLNPGVLDPRLQSVISLAYPYTPPRPPAIDWRAELRGRIAAYAIGPDYHDTVLAKAHAVAAILERHAPAATIRLYVDTGPVFEREWASRARLGWFGRNTNLLNRYHGSYFFLAEILTDLALEPSSEPYRDHCGTCRKCLDLCPTGALANGYLLEPRVCISYLTIEHRGAIAPELRSKLGNWIFGCDICQEVCPWNDDHTSAAPICDALMPSLAELLALDPEGFSRRFRSSAIKRTKRRGLLRNAAIALGNSGNPAAVPILARVLEREPEPLVRSHAAWAIGRFDDPEAHRILDHARSRESDPVVHNEIESALSGLHELP